VQELSSYSAFGVCKLLADRGIESTRDSFAEIVVALNVESRNDHVPEIAEYIRTVKERVRAIAYFLVFKKRSYQWILSGKVLIVE